MLQLIKVDILCSVFFLHMYERCIMLNVLQNESLSAELASFKKKYEELEVELVRVTENLSLEVNSKNSIEKTLTDKVQQLEMQTKEVSVQ